MRGLLLVAPTVTAVVVSLMFACGDEESSPSAQDGQARPAGGLAMEFETIDVGQHSGAAGQEPQVFKIETQAQWEEFWARHQAGVTPLPALPPVDFPRQMVIAALDQEEPSGGYRFEITGIEAVEGRLTVRVSKQAPGPDCLVTTVLTQPFHIVRTAKSGLEPELAISEEKVSCG